MEYIKGLLSKNGTYIIIIGIATAVNMLLVSVRDNDRTDFSTLLSAYEQENAVLREWNGQLLKRVHLLELKVSSMSAELLTLKETINE